MLNILWSILPIFVLIVLGNVLRRGGIPSIEFWNLNDKLVYWVLFPSLLFFKTSTTELAGGFLGPLAAAILTGLAAALIVSLGLGLAFGVSRPQATSILQGAARHNTFLALAISERLFGLEGLAVAALCTAVLIPPTNVLVISLMNILLRHGGPGGLWAPVARDLARNPLILSVGLGIGVNFADIGQIPVIHDATEMLGRAALPIVLLAVGASRDAALDLLADAAQQGEALPAELAMDNCPHQTVIVGLVEPMRQVEQKAQQRGLVYERLELARPYHTELFEPLMGPLREMFQRVEFRAVGPTGSSRCRTNRLAAGSPAVRTDRPRRHPRAGRSGDRSLVLGWCGDFQRRWQQVEVRPRIGAVSGLGTIHRLCSIRQPKIGQAQPVPGDRISPGRSRRLPHDHGVLGTGRIPLLLPASEIDAVLV